jgi:AraC-like DNA-binding protein
MLGIIDSFILLATADSDSLVNVLKNQVLDLISENDALYRVATLQKYSYYILIFFFLALVVLIALYYYELIEIRNKNRVLADRLNREADMSEKNNLSDVEISPEKGEYLDLINLIRSTNDYLDVDYSRDKLCSAAHISPSRLSEILKKGEDITFPVLVVNLRLEYSLKLLRDPRNHDTIESIAYDSGFHNARTLQRHFKSKYGLTPKEFRNGTNCKK